MSQSSIEAVVFDIGGVFLDWDPRHLYRKLIEDPVELEAFLSEICTPAWHAEQDLGKDIDEACEELALRHPAERALIEAWATRNEEMVAGVIAGVPELFAELLARDVPCYCLSNMEPAAFETRRVRFPFLNDFTGHVISGYEGVAKPDPRIFERLVNRFGLLPATTVFVDDRLVNVEAARDLGFEARLFTTAPALRCALEALGLLGATALPSAR